MLEPISTAAVAFATAASIVAGASTSIAASLATILAAAIAATLSVSGLCSAVASVLPPPTVDGKYSKFHNVVNKIAFNVGNAANRLNHLEEKAE